MKELRHHHCSFCNEAQSSTRRVLAGPGKNIGICEACVAFSRKVLRDDVPTEQKDGECSFCGKAPPQTERLAFGPGVNICGKCIAFAQRQLDGGEPTKTQAPGTTGQGWMARLRSLLTGGRAERTTTETV